VNEPILIAEYDPQWPVEYEKEWPRLAEALGGYALDIQHVGSTSVPGLAAKPIVDIAVAIREYPLPEQVIEAVCTLGYEHMGEYGLPRRHYFRKGTPRSHHVHAIEPDNPEWLNFVAFRDYLRAHPDVTRGYEAMKRQSAVQYEHDRVAYTDSKAPFISATLAKAKEWYARQDDRGEDITPGK
jgi:GrpB-like predicted nucleotidyltransferase (UPF0157 family)